MFRFVHVQYVMKGGIHVKYTFGTSGVEAAVMPFRGLEGRWSRYYHNEVENVDINARLVNSTLIRGTQIVHG